MVSYPFRSNLAVINYPQGKAKKTRKFAQVKRLLNPNDIRLCVLSSPYSNSSTQHISRKENQLKQKKNEEEKKAKAVRRVYAFHFTSLFCQRFLFLCPNRPQVPSSLFLAHNEALAPPYRVLIDTNFINFSLQNKLELISGMMDCLYAKCQCNFDRPTQCGANASYNQVYHA